MNRRFPRHLFAITGRLLLAVALVFSTGPWAAVLASTPADCPHMMGDMPHAAAHDCCPDADGAGGMPDCGKHGSLCTGICTAVCGLAGSCTVPAAVAFTGLSATAITPLPRSGVHAPSMFAAPALRPPISI
ncbi:MAG: hypothetical protein CVV14_00245 [Gammaproteobacteria bacterium HGW-Gammaproteobacteria-4]|jgi:hypothetical protein|nr:MAG: hypothetical protein CVV14_00245 [Gammaproteobacteria bacterium HGW-Gammaproteobacteria-4]